MDEGARKLRIICSIKESRWNETVVISFYLTLAGSKFHGVGATTEKARVPVFVFTRGMRRWFILECLAGVSIEFRYMLVVLTRGLDRLLYKSLK